jgi:hypothetical protein
VLFIIDVYISKIDSGLFDGIIDSTMSQDEMCKEAVMRVIRSSLYPPEQKERLRSSILKVINGEMTINAAANMFGLPSSTVHPYVHRVRAALGDNCPPQAMGPTPLYAGRYNVALCIYKHYYHMCR